MKKILTALLSVLLLSACTTEPDFVDTTEINIPQNPSSGETSADTSADTAAPDAAESFSVTYGSVKLEIGKALDLPALLGKPDDRIEAPSCVHEGNDAMYYYDGLECVTMMTDGGEILYTVSVTTEDAATAEGLKIGMTVDDAIALYGTATEAFGQYTFQRGSASLKLLTDPDGTVTSISITG